MLVHRMVTPSIKFADTHLYTCAVRVKCLTQEHNKMSPVRPRTRTALFGVELTNHEATAPISAVPERNSGADLGARGFRGFGGLGRTSKLKKIMRHNIRLTNWPQDAGNPEDLHFLRLSGTGCSRTGILYPP